MKIYDNCLCIMYALASCLFFELSTGKPYVFFGVGFFCAFLLIIGNSIVYAINHK